MLPFFIGGAVGGALLREDDGEAFEGGEGLVVVLVDACADARALGGAGGTVGVVELDRGAADPGEGVAEDLGLEHVGKAGVDPVDLHPHRLHDLDAVLEREDDAFLRRADEVPAVVDVEVDAVDAAAGFAVLQHPLGAVAEGEDADAVRADRNLRGKGVHFGI